VPEYLPNALKSIGRHKKRQQVLVLESYIISMLPSPWRYHDTWPEAAVRNDFYPAARREFLIVTLRLEFAVNR
jgi:hypothetical protein